MRIDKKWKKPKQKLDKNVGTNKTAHIWRITLLQFHK